MANNEKSYTENEIELTALDIIKINDVNDSKSDAELWTRYHSNYKDRFDYLTRIGEFDLPMQERNVPLQKRLMDLLIAKKSRRPFKYSVYFDSLKTKKIKFDDRIRGFITFAMNKAEVKFMEYEQTLTSMNQSIQQLKNVMAQGSQQGQEPTPEEIQQFQGMIRQLEYYQRIVGKEQILNQEYLDEFNMMLKMSPTAILEKIATKYLKHLERVVDFNYMSTMQFKNRIVTGKQNYMVAKFNQNKIVIKPLISSNIVYQKGGSEKYINKKDWVYYQEKMSFAQIMEDFGVAIVEKYGESTLMSLRDMYSPSTSNSEMWALPGGGVIFGEDIANNSYNYNNDMTIDIKWVWFRGSVPVSRRTNTDKNGKIHKHILPSRQIINKDDFKYSKGYYVNKKDSKKRFHKKEVSTYSKKSGDKIETKKYKKLYHAIVIDGEYVIEASEWKHIIRDVDNYNRFNLPIFGKSFDSVEDQPYSLIRATNDIQDLIDIIWLSREYMIAVAGTKGNVIDVSQKPDGMTSKEWEYHIKTGRIYIETIDANGVPKRSSFNQWQTFDNSVSQSVTYYDSLIENLTQMMGNIIGVPYQALGETTRADQVGTNKMAIQESQMVTEMLFYEHFMIDKEALEEYVSLSIQEADGNDIIFSVPNISGTEEYIFDSSKIVEENIKMNLYSSSEDEQRLNEMKQMTMQMSQSLNLSMGNIFKIFNSDTLSEMEARIEYFEEKAKKVQGEQVQAQKSEAMQTFKETKQFETEMEVYLEGVKNKYKEAEVYVKEAALQFEKDKFNVESQFKTMSLGLENQKVQISGLKVQQDNATETSMLLYDDKHQTFDNNLRALELQINTMFRSYELGLEAKGMSLENKKLDIENRKVSAGARSKPATTSYSKVND